MKHFLNFLEITCVSSSSVTLKWRQLHQQCELLLPPPSCLLRPASCLLPPAFSCILHPASSSLLPPPSCLLPPPSCLLPPPLSCLLVSPASSCLRWPSGRAASPSFCLLARVKSMRLSGQHNECSVSARPAHTSEVLERSQLEHLQLSCVWFD